MLQETKKDRQGFRLFYEGISHLMQDEQKRGNRVKQGDQLGPGVSSEWGWWLQGEKGKDVKASTENEKAEPGYQSGIYHSHTGFYFHNHRLSVFIPHLPDIQQIMRIAVMPWPAINKYPRPAATTVHHDTIVHIGVIGVCSFNVSNSRQVPCLEKQTHAFNETETINDARNKHQISDL